MPYDSSKDDYLHSTPSMHTYGKKSRQVTPSDTDDLDPYAKAVVCAASGNVSVLPAENDDGDTVNFTGVPAGYVPPFHVRRVMSTGTNIAVYTIDD